MLFKIGVTLAIPGFFFIIVGLLIGIVLNNGFVLFAGVASALVGAGMMMISVIRQIWNDKL